MEQDNTNIFHMNRIAIWISALLMVFLISSCKEQKLVGTWEYQVKKEYEEFNYTYKGIVVFENDGTSHEDGKARIEGETYDDGHKRFSLLMSVSATDDWELNDNEIIYSPTSCNVQVTELKGFDYDEFSPISFGTEYFKLKRQFEQSMKDELMKASTERILMLQKNKIVTEYTDDEGEKTTCTYKRIK